MRPEDIEYYSNFLKEFQAETDRGAALVGAALLDDKLSKALISYCRNVKESKSLIEPNGLLGSFGARIKMAYCLYLITDFEYRELEIIRKIRNEFAHELHGLSFNSPKIINLCRNLKSDQPGDISNNPRFLYVNAVVMMSLLLFYRPELVRKYSNKREKYDERCTGNRNC